MELWKENHAESEWPDCSTCQSKDASHVLDLRDHPSKEEIEKMCSDGFFAKHRYTYAKSRDVKNHCSPEENLEDLEEQGSFYCTPYGSREDVSGHSCPVEKKAGKTDNLRRVACNENNRSTPFYTSVGVPGTKRRHSEIFQDDHSSRIKSEPVYCYVKHIVVPVYCYCTIEGKKWNHGRMRQNVVMEVETGNSNKKGACQEEENLLPKENARGLFHSHGPSRTKRQNSTLQALFNNPRVEPEFYV